jgi:hypothetical protein
MAWEKWPVDKDGRPMALVTTGASEKIGLPQYSNVDIGPFQVTRFVEDDAESIRDGLRMCVTLVEQVIAEERDAVVEAVRKAKEGSGLG